MISRLNARLTLPCALLLTASAAGAETRIGAVAGVNGGYSSNPLLGLSLPGGSEGAATATASFSPTIRWEAPTNSLALLGSVERTVYSRQYDDITNWSLGSSFNQKLGVRSTISLGANVASRKNVSASNADTTDGSTPADNGVEDLGRRVTFFSGNVGFSTQFTARDSVRVSVFGSARRYGSGAAVGSDSDSIGGDLSYSRVLSATMSAVAGANYSHISYSGGQFAASDIVRPYVGLNASLSRQIELSVNAGADFTSIDSPTGTNRTTSFSGDIRLCHNGIRSTLCALADRSVEADSYGGTSESTSASLRYNYRLTSRSQFSVQGNYSERKSLSNAIINNNGGSYSNIAASSQYQHQLTERLSGVVSVQYLDRIKSLQQAGANIGGSLGLTYRLGR
jgi:hypothetical protein